MNIGLIHVDGKYPNLALMKLSAWHKAQGDEVEFYYPMKEYGYVYASKVFADSPIYDYLPENCKIGGWGYNALILPDEVEHTCPDYSLYGIDYAMGFASRGCIRNCHFCIVPEKEGKIRSHADIYEFWNGQTHIRLLDNNLTALPHHFKLICSQIIKHGIITDFSQGLDLRLITDDMAHQLSQIKPWTQFHFAWDNLRDEEAIRRGLGILEANGVAPYKCMVYVLIGFDTTEEEDYYRVMELRALGVDPFVMPYGKTMYERRFARWVNHKAIFKSVEWKEYVA